MERVRVVPVAEAEVALRDTGLIYLINQLILHRVGFALSFISKGEDEPSTRIEFVRSLSNSQFTFDPATREAGRTKLINWLHSHPNFDSNVPIAEHTSVSVVEDIALEFLRNLDERETSEVSLSSLFGDRFDVDAPASGPYRTASPSASKTPPLEECKDVVAELKALYEVERKRKDVVAEFKALYEEAKRKDAISLEKKNTEIAQWLQSSVLPLLTSAVADGRRSALLRSSPYNLSEVTDCVKSIGLSEVIMVSFVSGDFNTSLQFTLS